MEASVSCLIMGRAEAAIGLEIVNQAGEVTTPGTAVVRFVRD